MYVEDCAQCLLFVAVDIETEVVEESEKVSSQNGTKGYALLPSHFKADHPEVFGLFWGSNIQVIATGQEFSLPQAEFKMCEFQLLFRNSETEAGPSNPIKLLSVFVDAMNRELLKLLLSKNVDNLYLMNDRRAKFCSAIEEDNLKAVETILTHGADIGYLHPKGGTILHFAVEKGEASLVKLLLKYRANVEAERLDGIRPLHIAARNGFLQLVEILLDNKANANAGIETAKVHTPLVFAYVKYHYDIVNRLIERGANVNVHLDNDPAKPTILYLAAYKHHVQIVEPILTHCPDVNNKFNKIAFHRIMRELHDKAKIIFEIMCRCGFTIDNEVVENSEESLYGAIHKNCFGVVKKCLQAGVYINKEFYAFDLRPSKYTPLTLALRHAGRHVINLLLDHGANMNADLGRGKTPISVAIESQNLSAVELLITHKVTVWDGPKLVSLAAEVSSPEIVEFLLQKGALGNDESSMLRTLLRGAASKDNWKVLEILFRYGAQLSSEYVTPHTPLHDVLNMNKWVEGRGRTETFQTLLDLSFTNAYLSERCNFFNLTGHFPTFEDFLQHHNLSSFHLCHIKNCLNILARHIIKLESANLCSVVQNVASLWHSSENLNGFRHICEAEIVALQNETVGSSKMTYYEILTRNCRQLASCARNDSIVETMEAGFYRVKFPIYASILKYQFQKGYQRKKLVDIGIRICRFLCKMFRELPDDINKEIVSYLSNYDLFVLAGKMPRNWDVSSENSRIFMPSTSKSFFPACHRS